MFSIGKPFFPISPPASIHHGIPSCSSYFSSFQVTVCLRLSGSRLPAGCLVIAAEGHHDAETPLSNSSGGGGREPDKDTGGLLRRHFLPVQEQTQASLPLDNIMTSEATISTSGTKIPKPGYKDYYWLRSFVAGGIASCCAKSTIAPLDRIKILLQAQNIHYRHLGVLATVFAIRQKEGFLGLYKGNGAMMVRIFPYGAIQFMAFDKYKKLVSKKIGKSEHVHRLLAGSMAGITAVIFTYPLDMVRARLAFQVKGEHRYNGIIHAFKTIYTKEGGIPGYYRGLVPTIIGMAPYAGFSFFTFETLKTTGLKHAPELLGKPSLHNPDVLVLKTHASLLCGGVAGAIAQTISYPLDVARRRMQLAAILPDSEKCRTMLQTLTYVCKEHGIRKGLYRGLSLNYIRCIPSQAVAFTTYEFMRQILRLN